MSYLIDTNVLSELRRKQPDPGVVEWFARHPAGSLYLSVLTLGEIGACQDSCHLSHAAKGCLFVLPVAVATTDSRSGLSVTGPAGDQFRVWRDQRAGWRSRASTYKA